MMINNKLKKISIYISIFIASMNGFSWAKENSNVEYSKSSSIENSIMFKKYKEFDGNYSLYPVNYLVNNLPEKEIFDWYPQGYETIMLGGQPVFIKNKNEKDIVFTPHQSLSIWSSPYGSFGAGCSLCVFTSGGSANGGDGQAALSGLDPRLGAFSIANGDNAIAAFYIGQTNNLTRMVLRVKAFDAQGAILEEPLTFEQIKKLHHGMYINTNIISPDINLKNNYGGFNSNNYTGIISGWENNRINVYGWSILGSAMIKNGKYNKKSIVPDTQLKNGKWSNLDQFSSYTSPMLYVGDPGKYFGENDYVTMDMNRVYGANASSVVKSYERNEFDMRWRNIHKNNEASFHGYTLSFECDHCTAHYPFTEDSYGYLVNGASELPAAYVAQVYGDALEYKGYSTWIPGNGAADSSVTGSHHIMFDFSSQLLSNNTLHFGARSYHDLSGISDWRGYDVRLGLSVDGIRVRDHLNTTSHMSDLAWNFNGKIGSICLIEPDGNTNGFCMGGDGSIDVPGLIQGNKSSIKVMSASDYISAPNYGTSSHFKILSEIKSQTHSEGDRIWCHNCLNNNQRHGHGTGRWIYIDNASTWRSDDGFIAKD
ncbi:MULTISPECIES: hypothetical protein [Acetobacter]|uniref:hypothetical protein n=1 Tax=Acetobacter TaxID=434 RepID=UPI000A35FA51|nr:MULTISPECIES: hypothetical protein [Acetobacter]MBS0960852.1 hypothetical protein [Acetobacter thailandicus]OUJ12166.1 hypothetical protein HK25_00295 [Acetobacter sp. DsW_059]